MAEVSIDHVSDTAFLVAQFRAEETRRPDALFHDPLAAKLAGEKGRAIAESHITAGVVSWLVSVRTVIIDRFIKDAIEQGFDTVLNLGAGLDTRPYRLNMPGIRWIEADFGPVIEYKEKTLANETALCTVERVVVDLSDAEELRALLNRVDSTSKKVLVLTEGVLPYLSNEQVAALADDVHSIRTINWWIAVYFSGAVHQYRQRAGVSDQMKQAPFKFKPENWFHFFAEHSWQVRAIKYIPIEGRRLGRRMPVPRQARSFKALFSMATSKSRRRGMAESTGFAILEKAAPTT
jgi:methyltransferase (TIGR00027 family)